MKHFKNISILVTIIVFGLVIYVLIAPGLQPVESNPAKSHNPAGEDQDNNTETPETMGETQTPRSYQKPTYLKIHRGYQLLRLRMSLQN